MVNLLDILRSVKWKFYNFTIIDTLLLIDFSLDVSYHIVILLSDVDLI